MHEAQQNVSLDIRRALQRGYAGLTSKDGLNVFSALLVFNIAYAAVSQSFRQQLLEATRNGPLAVQLRRRFPPPFDLDLLVLELPVSLLAILAVAVVVGNEAVRFWAIQLFAGRPVPTLRERLMPLVWAGGGFALLLYGLRQVLPVVWHGQGSTTMWQLTSATGIAVAPLVLVTVYLRQEIALTEAGLAETVRNSVARFREAPVPTFVLLLLLAVLGQLTVLPAVVLSPVRTWSTTALLVDVLNGVLAAGLSTFSIAAITDAYLQVRDSGAEASGE